MHSFVVFAVGAVLAVHGAVKEKPAKGYYDSGNSQPAYPPPQQSPPAYQNPPVYYQPVYQPPQFALPNVDVNYCTVHASFPLAERRHHKHHHRRDRRQAYGQDGAAQSPPAYGAPAAQPAYGAPAWPYHHHHHSRNFDREHCRYTAIYSHDSCQTCCQIASAAMGSDTSQVSGGLFVFDPKLDHDDYKSDSKSNEHDKEDKRVLQCICCLPKPV